VRVEKQGRTEMIHGGVEHAGTSVCLRELALVFERRGDLLLQPRCSQCFVARFQRPSGRTRGRARLNVRGRSRRRIGSRSRDLGRQCEAGDQAEREPQAGTPLPNWREYGVAVACSCGRHRACLVFLVQALATAKEIQDSHNEEPCGEDVIRIHAV
jgi:hypothetical protein